MNVFNLKSRKISLLVIFFIYTIALFSGMGIYYLVSDLHLLFSFFIANISATVIVWIFGLVLKNSSVYDPYWSVAPIIIVLSWTIFLRSYFTITGILLLSAIIIWGIRLTLNWALRWGGLKHQDWRYSMLKRKSPKTWFLTNLAGINIMPTIIVYIALIPAYFTLSSKKEASFFTGFAFLICFVAIAIQAVSDIQMDSFKKRNKNRADHIDRGLWRYSRHPNYFGEVLFWWGIWLMQLSLEPGLWFTVAGPLLMTLLFIFVSIPMMEKYILGKIPSYNKYQKKVSALMPWIRLRT